MSTEQHRPFNEGQFDDAEDGEQQGTPAVKQPEVRMTDPHGRAKGAYIDEENLLDWSDPEEDEEVDEDDLDEAYFEENRVEDEDWDVTERGSYW